jgi:hypothetical protein
MPVHGRFEYQIVVGIWQYRPPQIRNPNRCSHESDGIEEKLASATEMRVGDDVIVTDLQGRQTRGSIAEISSRDTQPAETTEAMRSVIETIVSAAADARR